MKTIPFDLAKAKTPDNPDGLEVVDGYGHTMRIMQTNAIIVAPDEPINGTREPIIYNGAGILETDEDDKRSLRLALPDSETDHSGVWVVLYKTEYGWFKYRKDFTSWKDAARVVNVIGVPVKIIKLEGEDVEP